MAENATVTDLGNIAAGLPEGGKLNYESPEHPEERTARLKEAANKASFNRWLVGVLLVTVVGFAVAAFFHLSSSDAKTAELARTIISGVVTALLGFLAGLGAGKIS